MPTNVTAEYTAAEQEYQRASGTAEKITALEKMHREVPKHKGTEKLRQEIKTKLAKYRQKQEKEKTKAKGRALTIPKEGAATVCLVGMPNSGKSSILKKLSGAKAKIADYEYTTKMPIVGIMDYQGLKLQMIEIPAIFEGYNESERGPQFLSIVRQADLVLIIADRANLDTLFSEFKKAKIVFNERQQYTETLKSFIVINKKDIIDIDKVHQGLCRYYNLDLFRMSVLDNQDINELKKEIWDHLDLIKIRTKQPGKKVSKGEPLCLKKGATIKDMAKHLHKDFIKRYRFARIWGKSAKFDGQQVGLNHQLMDEDIVEIHLR